MRRSRRGWSLFRDHLTIGEIAFEVRDIITKEPDRAVSFASFGPGS